MLRPLEGRRKPHVDLINLVNNLQNPAIIGTVSAKLCKTRKTVIIPDVQKVHIALQPSVNKTCTAVTQV